MKRGFAPVAVLVLLFLIFGLVFAVTRVTDLKNVFQKPRAAGNDSISKPEIYPSPVIRWGNSSYHDSLGARDPWAVKDGGTTYLYFDCIEDLLNPSFESNPGVNGWDTYEANISSSVDRAMFGQQSLKMITNDVAFSVPTAGAFTGNYYYQNIKDDAHLAVPTGLEVIPNTTYLASVYVWANVGDRVGLVTIEYKDDPGFWNNRFEPYHRQDITGNGQWQRLIVKITTSANTKAITLSFVADGRTTSYWDGVQLERVENNQNSPTDFPSEMNFNKSLEDTAGWRSCVATSTDGISFQKRGLVEIQGIKENWQDNVKPGWVGIDSNYLNVFPFQGKWYAYTWVAGYPVVPGNISFQDSGQTDIRRIGYADRRGFLPIGLPIRSAILEADSPLGPFRRVSRGGPVVSPLNEQQCSSDVRNNNLPWGCEYIATSGTPHQIEGQWVLFLSGNTLHQKGVASPWGSWLSSSCQGDMINSGLATSNSPLGPWTPSSLNPLFSAQDVCKNALVPEGPIYYFDRLSKNHVIFTNQLTEGQSVTAFWTKSPLTSWPVDNREVVIDSNANGMTSLKPNGMNLSTVVEDGNKLVLYFGYREAHAVVNPETPGLNNYLFHNIGKATFTLPLFSVIDETDGKKCSISISNSSISTSQSVMISGTGTKYISRTDSENISGLGPPIFTDSQGHKYYQLSSFTVSDLAQGSYKLWCNQMDDPGKCSGNPFCSYKGANPGVAGCEGWASCGNNDNVNLTVVRSVGLTAKSCSISAVVSGQTVTVNSSGAGGPITNYISRSDTKVISGLGNPIWTDGSGHKYYALTSNSIDGLAQGDYKIWCNQMDDPGKCSGNPFCSDLPPSECAGWARCSASDNTTATVTSNTYSGVR